MASWGTLCSATACSLIGKLVTGIDRRRAEAIAKIRINLFWIRHKQALRSTEMQILEPSDPTPTLDMLLKVAAQCPVAHAGQA